MIEPSPHAIASSITLITVSLLATTLIVLFPTWRRFQAFWEQASTESRRITFGWSFVLALFPVLIVAAAWISVLVSTKTWYMELPNVGIILTLSLILLGGVYQIFVVCRRKWRERKGTKEEIPPLQPELLKEIAVTSALCYFLIAIMIMSFAVMSATPVAIDVAIGGFPHDDDFEFARAMLVVTPSIIFFGLFLLGSSFWAEIYYGTSNSKTDKSVPEAETRSEPEES